MAANGANAITGVEKAAVLLVALGVDKAAEVLSLLSGEEVEQLTGAISAMPIVDAATREAVVAEVIGRHAASDAASAAGPSYAHALLERAFGAEAAARGFAQAGNLALDALAPSQLIAMLRGAHPQTIAFVLSTLPSDKAAAVFAALSADLQTQVAVRMVRLESTPPEVLGELRETVRERLSGLVGEAARGGTRVLVDLLENADRTTERGVIASLEREAPQLAHDIRERFFAFEDLARLDSRLLQRLIRETTQQELTMALAGADADLREAILGNVSRRRAAAIEEDLESLGAVRLRDVEAAQRRMAARARQLIRGVGVQSEGREGWAVA